MTIFHERVPKVRVVHVECECGWQFATLNLLWAETIMKNHDCSRFISTGKDEISFEEAEAELS